MDNNFTDNTAAEQNTGFSGFNDNGTSETRGANTPNGAVFGMGDTHGTTGINDAGSEARGAGTMNGAAYGMGGMSGMSAPDSVMSYIRYRKMASTEGLNIINNILLDYHGEETNVIIPPGVININNFAFSDRDKITSVQIPESVSHIGDSVFTNCTSLERVNIPDYVYTIGNFTFSGCSSLKEIKIPEGVTSIGYGAFGDCAALTEIYIPDSVTSIGNFAFKDCTNLKSVHLPKYIEYIGDGAFNGCTSLADENGFIIIDGILFSYCGNPLSADLPEGITYIDDFSFKDCPDLAHVSVPESINYIDESVFENCRAMKTFRAPGITAEQLPENLRIPAAVSYLKNPQAYTDYDVVRTYREYIFSSMKEILAEVFSQDASEALIFFDSEGKITGETIDTMFLDPANDAGALQCISYLMEWKNSNMGIDAIDSMFSLDFDF